MEIEARNVNAALHDALWWLQTSGVKEPSRNGPVLVSPEPVLTIYQNPLERVLFSDARNANPYFHLMEALWMLAGRNDVAFPQQFNSRFKQYAEEDGTVHGAYGHRWRAAFQMDQLQELTTHLKAQPASRRSVLQMWDAQRDLVQAMNHGHDVPCNTHAYLDLRSNQLNMTVCCRSNDALWGAYGANAVHFSVLLEFLAAWLDVPVGTYRHFSHNLHVYIKMEGYPPYDPVEIGCDDRYDDKDFKLVPLIRHNVTAFERDLRLFLEDPLNDHHYIEPFFTTVAQPMYTSWYERKTKRNSGRPAALQIEAEDWQLACLEWIERRGQP